MADDHGDDYDAVRSLRAELEEIGEDEWSAALYDAMTYNSSVSEVRGELRRVLLEIRDRGVAARLRDPPLVDAEIRAFSRLLGLPPP